MTLITDTAANLPRPHHLSTKSTSAEHFYMHSFKGEEKTQEVKNKQPRNLGPLSVFSA